MRRMRVTELDREIWRFLFGRFEQGLGSPSVKEIALGCYCSHPKVLATITKLEALGYVTWAWLEDRRAARGCLIVVAPDDELAKIDREREVELAADRAERALANRERAKLRMRHVRAVKNGSLISFE